ncbi:Ferritin heavy chain A [Parelaphostrongylus tenuis]|uniref:Ferritin n=1 Tax=Parelaphostrongylus tenuis TaxID=148309 RepID=A0AAD5QM83_PARTN|nr:Ferritin heavy chain A [Parelaphostrongylus tenuis]
MESQVRMNYAKEVEAAVNKQVNIELYASYVYLSMAMYFDREDVALAHISKWLRKQSDEEREHAIKFMTYQNVRGGSVLLQPVNKPEKDEWGSPLEAFQAALALEKFNNQCLLDLHAKASANRDAHLCDYLESHFLDEQVESIAEIAKIITNLKRVGTGLGEYIFDKEHFES